MRSMVQLAIEGMNPMPKEYTPVPTLPKVPQLFVAGAVAVRPAGMVMLPPLMNADMAPGLESVSVSVEFAPGNTLPGAKATVIDTVGAATPVTVSDNDVGVASVAGEVSTLTVSVSVIAAVGVAVISKVQEFIGSSIGVIRHWLDAKTLKPAPPPLKEILLTLRMTGEVLVKVACCDALVEPTVTLPKLSPPAGV